jgi:hypothetical protein
MALIQCPECDQQISDAAACCVHCGFPLAQVKKQDEPCDVETDQDQRPNSVVKVLPTDVDIGTLDEYWAMTTEIVDDLLNVRWHWQLAMCAGWTLVTGLVFTGILLMHGRPTMPAQPFWMIAGLFWWVGYLGSWMIGKPRRGLLLSSAIFLAAAVMTAGLIALISKSLGWSAIHSSFSYCILGHVDGTTSTLVVFVIGVINLILRLKRRTSPK